MSTVPTSALRTRRFRSRRLRRLRRPIAAGGLAVGLLAGCGGDSDRLTIYSGRSEELVGPLLDRFADETGIEIDVFYDGSAEVALKLDAEGDRTPADVFLSQAPGPLGFLDAAGRFDALPSSVLDHVSEAHRAADGDWVGVSGRARVLVYDPDSTPDQELPASVLDLTDEAYEGRVGIAPSNSSFQDWISALRVSLGDEATSALLEGLAANNVRTYPNNTAIIDAVDRGEIDIGLVNHYYVLELQEQDPDLGVRNHFFPADDPGNVLLVSGVAVLDTTDQPDEARRFVDFLLSEESQAYLATATREFPLVDGVETPDGVPALDAVSSATVDLALLGEQFSSTRDLIEDAGLAG
jgi:iron(III) transport system substrate-binding protein